MDRCHIRQNLSAAIDQIRWAEAGAIARASLGPLLEEAALGAAGTPPPLDRQGTPADAGAAQDQRALGEGRLEESFEHFWTYTSATWAGKFLEAWCARVRRSSEMPFFPGAQRAFDVARKGELGRILEVDSGFHHSSELDPTKAANWKRFNATCGEGGVLNDLGMHASHVPLRLGWKPARLFAQLQKVMRNVPMGKAA